ncbi:MAG: FAD-binding oxidoreductase, partial [Flavobacteriia bacterium]|nr:FAD-binding oxidoreductase [Flavobacteriia bacterium]
MRVGIIGQGFAGTALAWRAHWAGHTLFVFDQGHAHSASWVAAGLVNPLVLKRKRLVQEAHAHIAAFSPFYDRVERETGLSVRHSGEIHEVLSDAAAENAWASLGAERGFEAFIGPIHSVSDPRIQASSTASVHHSARLRAQTYLSASREFFAAQHTVREEAVESLAYQNGAWHVNDIEDLEVVLLAEGVQARWTHQYFGELPFAPTKGEGLKIRWKGPEVPVALHKNVFLLPDG